MKIKYLLVCVVLLLSGCTNKPNVEKNDSFKIVTSFYPVYIFTKNITKDVPNVSLANMTSNHSGCLHNYTLTTSDMKMLDDADVFVINGAGLETFLEKVYLVKEDLEVIDSSKNINLLTESFSDDDNEHIWLSVTNAILQVKNIGQRLSEIDSHNASLYDKNTNEYIKKLESLRNELRASTYGNEDVEMVTGHDAFPYFAEDFGFDIVEVIEKEEDTFPTSKEMQEIVDVIKSNEIKAIFIEKDSSSRATNVIANESGAKVLELDTITNGDGSLDDYENRMRENIRIIRESL